MFTRFFSKIKDFLLNILFPPLCVNCNAYLTDPSEVICKPCLSSIRIYRAMHCPVCARRLPDNKKICHTSSRFLLAAASTYENQALRALVHSLKYKGIRNAAKITATLLVRHVNELAMDLKDHLIIPIPLSPQRLRERGFNQAQLIAEHFADHFNVQVKDNAVCRTRHVGSQTGLSKEERKENVMGCFAIKHSEAIKGKNIIVIDDVFTSGATMGEVARILRKAGARKIVALVAAKA